MMPSLTDGLPEGARGQVLALGIAVLAAALLWFGLAAPVLDWYADRAELLKREQATAARMAALAQALPELRRRAADLAAQAQPVTLLEGASDGVAAAALQDALEQMASAAGTRIASAEPLPAEQVSGQVGGQMGELRAISLRITLSAPWKPVIGLLAAIAASDTPMLVDNLQLRGLGLGSRDPDRPVDAAFSVTAWRSGHAAEAAAP